MTKFVTGDFSEQRAAAQAVLLEAFRAALAGAGTGRGLHETRNRMALAVPISGAVVLPLAPTHACKCRRRGAGCHGRAWGGDGGTPAAQRRAPGPGSRGCGGARGW